MHPVTALQELCQKSGLPPPEYAYGAESTRGPHAGPLANNPGPHIFHATVTVRTHSTLLSIPHYFALCIHNRRNNLIFAQCPLVRSVFRVATNSPDFRIYITLQVDSWKERSAGRSKKLAKRHAAAKLLKILRERTSRGGSVGSSGKQFNEDECDEDEQQEDENDTFVPLVRFLWNFLLNFLTV